MRRKIWLSLLILVVIVSIVLGINTIHLKKAKLKKTYSFNSTPTLLVHGWTGSLKSESQMVKTAEKIGVAKTELIIHVKPNGKLNYIGHYHQHVKNPIIEIVFDNNRAGEFKDAAWIKSVIKSLKNRYHIKRFNAVGHSMGSYALLYYCLLNGKNPNLPKPNKLVLIAGPYDGIINNHKLNQPQTAPLSNLWEDKPNENALLANGRPKIVHPEYRRLLRLRKNIPRNIRVLNIYGNLENGSNSDGVVTITSARSLGFLLRGRIAKYKELKVVGENAQHSKLHKNNFDVNRGLISFLWKKEKLETK